MATSKYVAMLVSWGSRSAANQAALEKQSCDLRERIITYGGGQLVSVAAPGQHVALNFSKTIQQEWEDVEEAIAILNGKPAIVQSVYPVFW